MHRLPQGVAQPSQAEVRIKSFMPEQPDRQALKLHRVLVDRNRNGIGEQACQGPRDSRQKI